MSARRRTSPAGSALRSPSLFLLFQLVVTPLYAVAMLLDVLVCRAMSTLRDGRELVRRQPVGARLDLRHPLAA